MADIIFNIVTAGIAAFIGFIVDIAIESSFGIPVGFTAGLPVLFLGYRGYKDLKRENELLRHELENLKKKVSG